MTKLMVVEYLNYFANWDLCNNHIFNTNHLSFYIIKKLNEKKGGLL